MALNDSKQLNAPGLSAAGGGTLPGSQIVFAPAGGVLAQSPAFKTNFRARYEWNELPWDPFVQLVLTHTSHQRSQVGGILRSVGSNLQQILISDDVNGTISAFYEDPITRLDLAAGFTLGAWSASVYVDNVTNERGQNFITGTQFVESVVVDRPLTAGVKLGYRF